MKTLIATVTIATLWAGATLAQKAPQTPGNVPTPRATDTPSSSPTNGIGGTGGGRLQTAGPGDLNGDGKSDNRAEAAINTSRSNIKKPSIAGAGDGSGTGSPVPAKAIISTTRSNIKKPSIARAEDGSSTASPVPAKAIINTTRSNIKKPQP